MSLNHVTESRRAERSRSPPDQDPLHRVDWQIISASPWRHIHAIQPHHG